uniref:Si:ch73-194h10.2 n=1 Tax=Salarias fasciatus TaxID=181472 RepID=A0A672G4R0_SALFA
MGDFVWMDTGHGVPIGAEVTVTDTGQLQLTDDEGKEHRLNKKTQGGLRSMHPSSVKGVDDMISLGDLSEAGLLRNLLVRHKEGNIYTYTGSILVAVNPYQLLPIYTMDYVHMYTDRRLGELPPHVFAIADSCFFNMRRTQSNQCCIISGESGAGKTENTKLMLQFLAAVSGQHSWIEQQVLEANPILEAFGNAKTTRNDNSSRFGKYIDISFSKEGAIEGARIEQYLLEKSRVCRQAPEERNYHVFYDMLMGMPEDQKKLLSLGSASEYKYLTMGKCTSCEGRDDGNEYAHFRSALKVLTFSENDSWEISKLLAAILHLGNVNFTSSTVNNLEGSDIAKSSHFTMASKLLEVDPKALEDSLTQRSFMTARESVVKPLNTTQAMDGRDAFVKAIYGRLFIWVVHKINKAIYKPPEDESDVRQSIGLLDIFGFENFAKNSFEQLCINFANEQLQQFFVKHVFKLEQEEYAREGIVWKHIDYQDNQSTLDVLANKPMNMLALIDEESNFPKGTDATLLQKLNQVHGKGNIYLTPKNDHDTQFGIQHFAGAVYYDSKGFLEKNRDALSTDLIQLVETSANKLLKSAFHNELSGSSSTIKSSANPKMIITPSRQTVRRVPTLSGQFRKSLDLLMKTLTACQPYFIRCIKPNDFKRPKVFDRELCMTQLRYSGMMETIRIRKAGYPVRYSFDDFLNRYRVLLRAPTGDPKKVISDSCQSTHKHGTLRVFSQDFHDTILELERMEQLNTKALLIQKVMRGYKYRRDFLRKKAAVLVIQKHWRGYKGRKLYRTVQLGFARLQAQVRSRQLCFQYKKKREAALVLQAHAKGYLARKEFRRKRDAVILLQAHTRGMLARKALKEKERAVSTTRNFFTLTAGKKIRICFPLTANYASFFQRHLSAREKERERQAMLEKKKRLEEVLKRKKEMDDQAQQESITNQEMVDEIFGFLPTMVGGREGDAPAGLEVRPSNILATVVKTSMMIIEEIDIDEIPMEENSLDEDEDDGLDEYSFSKFATMYFQGAASASHVRQRLRQPLLYHEDEGDILASLTVWWIIQRFMGDSPEPRMQGRVRQSAAQERFLPQDLEQSMSQRQTGRLPSPVTRSRLIHRTEDQNRGSKQPGLQTVEEDSNVLIGEGPTMNRPLTSMEKLHIIVGYAILRPELRDEIYCQICKQIQGNNNRRSYFRGWILLSLCLGVFPPSDRFYLQSFVHSAPESYASFCAKRLRRTLMNGMRGEPPAWLELQATKTMKPIIMSVMLLDGRSINLPVDSASTSREICQLVANKIKLQDTFGFSVYVALYDKVWALGSGREHVMDAISQCEQEVKRRGGQEQHAPWRLIFRKEIFTPWHDSKEDKTSTDLIHRQIIHGLKFGEYRCEREDDLVQLAAQHLYVLHETDSSTANVKEAVQDCIKNSLLESKSEAKWLQMVSTAHAQGPYLASRKTADLVKADMVDFAREAWPMLFSRFFQVTKVSGPPLPKNKFIVAINWTGITFLDEREKRLLQLSFPEVTKVSGQTVSLLTLKGDFHLSGSNAEDMAELVTMFIGGLTERSQYAVALKEMSRSDDPTLLSFKKGELIIIIKDNEFSQERGWIKGQVDNTKRTGAVPIEAILILPTLSKPSNENLINLSPNQRKNIIEANIKQTDTMTAVAPVTLKEFSLEYFRYSRLAWYSSHPAVSRERLWAHSREPIRQPLLQKLGNSELSHKACLAFTDILHMQNYMGDYPTKQMQSPLELTDQIFGPATKYEALRDEIYCQIMKQMTNNNNRFSMEQGWQLLWLCCGLFPPSKSLLRHAQRFVESRRRQPLASDCLQRMQDSLRMEPRKLPPHQVELDAIKQNSTQIFHKVHFPNDTDEIFEVATSTRVKDLIQSIVKKLKLASADGFSIFVKIQDKVLSLNDSDYFFDSLRNITDYSKGAKRIKDGNVNISYRVFFMRKLWFNVIPGRDPKADSIFHFPQELPKYLRGYHISNKEDVLNIASLLLRIKIGKDKSQLVMIPKLLKELVPADQLKALSENEWKKNIAAAFNKQAASTAEEAKVAFLKTVSRWPTFGCAFFEVKQTSEPNFPDIVRIAISKQGLTIIHPKTKEVLANHPFNRIANWSSGSTYFHMTIGSLVKGTKFLCETSLGYKMDDLISSYVNMYVREKRALQARNQRFNM